MKRVAIVVGSVILLLVIGVGALVAVTFLGRKPIADGSDINGVRIVADGIVTIGVVPAGGKRVALIDAGNDKDGAAIKAELSRRGIGPDDVAAVFLTHGHQDHIAAVPMFPQAQVIALAREVGLVEGREGAHGPVTRLLPVSDTGIRVTHPARDGETVMAGTAVVRVFAVPGHTAGSAAYLVDNVLFVGDSADADSAGRLQGAPWIFSDSQPENRASLASLASRIRAAGANVAAIVPAHSGALTDGFTQLDAFAP